MRQDYLMQSFYNISLQINGQIKMIEPLKYKKKEKKKIVICRTNENAFHVQQK